MKLNDKSHYLDILNVRPPITPENICGRGITVINKEVVEFQIALVSSGNNEAERLENIVDEYQELKHAWQGYKPIAIDESSDVAPKAEEDDKKTAPITRSYAVKQQQPKSVEGSEHILVLAASKSGALKFGIDLDEKFKTSVLADDIGDLRVYFAKIIASISTFDNRRIVLLDNELKHFEDICDMHANCQYLSSVQDVNVFIGSIKAELNDRLDGTDKCKERLFIIIPEFNGFFNMITNEQADFVRKLVKYINQPKYGVQFSQAIMFKVISYLTGRFMNLLLMRKIASLVQGHMKQRLKNLRRCLLFMVLREIQLTLLLMIVLLRLGGDEYGEDFCIY